MGKFIFTDEKGTWVQISDYAHPDPDMPSLTLLPMVHIGEKPYFKEMNNEMWRHDTVFMEGCYMRGRKLFHLFHRGAAKSSALSMQSGKLKLWKRWKKENRLEGKTALTEVIRKSGCDCGKCYHDELRTIRADFHRWHAMKAFRQVPLWIKLSLPFLILAALIAAPFMNLRDHVFNDETDEDEDDEEAFFLEKLTAPFWKFIIEDRDLFLRMTLAEEILQPRHKGGRLCVKYGAKHMAALADTFLKDFGYSLANQRQVLAIKKTKEMDIADSVAGYGFSSKKYWEEYDAKQESLKPVEVKVRYADTQNLITFDTSSEEETSSPTSFSIQDLQKLQTTKAFSPAPAN